MNPGSGRHRLANYGRDRIRSLEHDFLFDSLGCHDVRLLALFKGVAPFILTDLVRLGVLVAFPWLVLFLPSTMGWCCTCRARWDENAPAISVLAQGGAATRTRGE